jgi:acyl-CoA thioesterase-1
MNRRTIFWSILIFPFLLSCQRHRADNPSDIAVIAFGDSLTAGQGLPDPATQAYPALLEKEMRRAGLNVTVLNAGLSGDTCLRGLQRLDGVLSRGGDMVIVALGSNDALNGRPLDEIEQNLNNIVQRVLDHGMEPLLCDMYTLDSAPRAYYDGFKAIFPRVAARYNIVLIPFMLKGVMSNPPLLQADHLHPNIQGAAAVAGNMLPTVAAEVRHKSAARGG